MEPDLDRFESRRSTVYAPNGIVATSQPLAARAGASVLESGGNAFDAAVATAAALNVVEPTSTGLGGDVFGLYRTADGDIGGMRSCGGAPADATIDAVREAVSRERGIDAEAVSMPRTGPHTVTVPGTARGWEATIERFGRHSLAEVLDPAIEYAREGYPVTEVVAAQWEHADDLFTDDHAREAYLPGDRPPHVGETVSLPRLGESLSLIARKGADVVYEGEIAAAIVEAVRDKGGFLARSDLAGFDPEFVDPVSTTYGGAEVYELPPNNQGLIVLEALNIAEALGAGECDDPVDRVHYLAEATKRAFVDGHHYITDPDYETIPDLVSEAYARERADEITREATDPDIGVPGSNAEFSDTVLLAVADDEGNVVSYINSRFAGFGSGLVAGETGIALQNRGASFSLDPDHPNRLEPGKRPFHTLIPAIATLGAEDWAAFGVMGGFMQPQGHVQVLSQLLDRDRPLQAALDAPRWRYLESGELAVEARMDDRLATKLARRGHDVTVLPPGQFGGAQIVRNDGSTLSGATEPRKDGSVVGY
ncbi:MAG: gamma-glutamyltransferase family protein [Halobacteriales archaeon]